MTLTLPPGVDPLGADCTHCGAEPGGRCMMISGWARKPHTVRVKLALVLAAHADPALDAHFPAVGPCGFCGPELPQRHRVVDAIAERLEADEDPEDTAGEFGVTLEAVEAVALWMVRWPGAWA